MRSFGGVIENNRCKLWRGLLYNCSNRLIFTVNVVIDYVMAMIKVTIAIERVHCNGFHTMTMDLLLSRSNNIQIF